jgi:hypothetical protein
MTDIVWKDGRKIGELQPAPKRWSATFVYDDRTIVRDFDELSELHDFVEGGPNLYSIAAITITINPKLNRQSYLEDER